MTKAFPWLASVIVLAVVSGCAETTENPPDGFFRMIHAAPGEGAISFLLEEVPQATLGYKQGTQLRSLDSGPFDFNVEITRPGETDRRRVLSFPVDIIADHQHTFVLLDNTGGLSTLLLDNPTQRFESDATQSEIQILHVAEAFGAADVYLEAPGTNIPGAMPRGSLAFGEDIPPLLLSGGDYQLTLTAVGEPANVLFSSNTFTLDESVAFLAMLVDGAGQGTVAASVLLIDPATSQEIFDETAAPGLRTIHASAASGGLDVALDNDFANLLFAGVTFGQVTGFQSVTPEGQITVTPTGNAGVMEFDQTLDLSEGSLNTLLLTGEPGTIAGTIILEDFRGLTRGPRLRVYNGYSESGLDLYLVPPGTTDLSDESPELSAIPFSGVSPSVIVPAGNFDLVFTQVADKTIIGGPASVSLSSGTAYSIATFDDPSGTGFTIMLLDGF